MDVNQTRDGGGVALPAVGSEPTGYASFGAKDPTELTEQLRDWNFEFTQLNAGKFKAQGCILQFDSVSLARMSLDRTLIQRGYAPHGMVAIFIPGAGSGPVYVRGQPVVTGQCATLGEGANLDAITHDGYLDVSFGFDLSACRAPMEWLNGGQMLVPPGTCIAAPGPAWTNDMLARIDWLLASVMEHPACLADSRLRSSLADHVLAALVQFNGATADVDATSRSARAGRRAAVRIACELIHSKLTEPLRLSELCRHSHLKIRSLEYGFREVTGLTPVAYIRSLRLNSVRRALQDNLPASKRSISEIAMDAGFWHLSQFSMDYRRMFGETPSDTRRRSLRQMGSAFGAD